MYKTLASVALMASSAHALAVGHAHVVNACKYPVTLCNVPAQYGGFSQIDAVLQHGDTYSQQWTELSNLQGWSIKLSKDSTLANIMQFEYTWHNDGIIWYDISDVDGNPWDGNWEINASSPLGNCIPRQAAYRYSTDDAYGMQACSQDAEITVTLCSGDSQDSGSASSASASVAAPSTQASALTPASPPTSSAAPAPATASWSYTSSTPSSVSVVPVASASTPVATSTQVTISASSSTDVVTLRRGNYVTTITEVEVAVVTQYVTATYWQGQGQAHVKRHDHPARHPHGRRL